MRATQKNASEYKSYCIPVVYLLAQQPLKMLLWQKSEHKKCKTTEINMYINFCCLTETEINMYIFRFAFHHRGLGISGQLWKVEEESDLRMDY